MIIYTIEAFNKESELLEFEVNIPQNQLSEFSSIMGWSIDDLKKFKKGFFVADINNKQAVEFEKLLQKKFYSDTLILQMSGGNVDIP